MDKFIEFLTGPVVSYAFEFGLSFLLTVFKVLFAFGSAYLAATQKIKAKNKKLFYVQCFFAALAIAAVMSTARPDENGDVSESAPKTASEGNSLWAKNTGIAFAVIIFGSQFFTNLTGLYENSKREAKENKSKTA
jgi:hypothetical protein